ncbi:MAG: hypothetical protein HQK62_11735 [Desulfamplus sp.]|nr:hypothetical protein [Desulfamplus sp.]
MKKTLVLQLTQAPPLPKEYETLRKFRKDRVAQYLGVTPAYFYNILSGSKKPSEKLHSKMMELISDIESENMEAN